MDSGWEIILTPKQVCFFSFKRTYLDWLSHWAGMEYITRPRKGFQLLRVNCQAIHMALRAHARDSYQMGKSFKAWSLPQETRGKGFYLHSGGEVSY